MFKGNKWEWSELYALLRILADEKIYATDSETKEYTAGEMISIYINGEKVKELPLTELESESVNLLNVINSKDSKYAFSVESTQNCVDRILCYKIFTPAIDKNDIMVKNN